jgi:type 1 fimbria pilin
MNQIFKMTILSSLLVMTAGAYAAAPSATVQISGTVVPTTNNCKMTVPTNIDLGSVALEDFITIPVASESQAKPMVVEITDCNPGQVVQLHISGTKDNDNKMMFANTTTEGGALFSGVAIHEHVNGAINVISPSGEDVTQDIIDENGNASHDFTVSYTRFNFN